MLAAVFMLLAVPVGIWVGRRLNRRMRHIVDDAINEEMFEGFDMITRGVHWGALEELVKELDLEVANLRAANERGDAWAFLVKPPESSHELARKAPSGRRGPWLCYHGYEMFITGLWGLGMSSLNTVGPAGKRKTYRSRASFEGDLDAFAERQMGSAAYPVQFADLCAHDGTPWHLLGLEDDALEPHEKVIQLYEVEDD